MFKLNLLIFPLLPPMSLLNKIPTNPSCSLNLQNKGLPGKPFCLNGLFSHSISGSGLYGHSHKLGTSYSSNHLKNFFMKSIITDFFLHVLSPLQYIQNLQNDLLSFPLEMSYKSHQLRAFAQLMKIHLKNHLERHQNFPECNICLGLEDILLIRNQSRFFNTNQTWPKFSTDQARAFCRGRIPQTNNFVASTGFTGSKLLNVIFETFPLS